MSEDFDRDPFDELIRGLRADRPDARPADEYLLPGVDRTADAMLAAITSTPIRRRMWWRKTTVVVVGVSTLIGAGVATAVLVSRGPADPSVVGCRDSAASNANVELVVAAPGATPVELCSPLWLDGRIATSGAPTLTPCVTDEDVVQVVPGDRAVCAALGWVLDATAELTGTDRAAELTSRLSDTFAGSCFDPAEAVAAATDILTELGLVDWSVDTSGTVEGRCNHPSPVHQTKTIAFSPL